MVCLFLLNLLAIYKHMLKIKVRTLLDFQLLFDDYPNFSSSVETVINLEQIYTYMLGVYYFLHVSNLLWTNFVCLFLKVNQRGKFCSSFVLEIFVSNNPCFPSFTLIDQFRIAFLQFFIFKIIIRNIIWSLLLLWTFIVTTHSVFDIYPHNSKFQLQL